MSVQMIENDLINLHDGSPVLPRALSVEETSERDEVDNLLDTELPALEKKLQTATQLTNINDSRRASVDIEDILISLDDDEPLSNINNNETENVRKEGNSPLTCDNLDALVVLQNLDELLNACFSEDDDIALDNEDIVLNNIIDDHCETVEDCLMDLDNYLKTLDSSGCDELNESSVESNATDCINDNPSTRSSTSSLTESAEPSEDQSFSDVLGSTSEETIDDEHLRIKLRQMEENYTRFLASGCINRGYVDTEGIGESTNENDIRRPLSACGVTSSALSRNLPHRATVAVIRRERSSLNKTFRKSVGNSNHPRCITERISGTAVNSDENIDWSWVQDVARDVVDERRAHAAGDCCTGTVVVEPPGRTFTLPSRSAEVVMSEEVKEGDRRSNTWLRNSMRRLRHIRLPSNAEQNHTDNVTAPTVMDVPRTEPFTAPVIASTPIPARPVSAPSRLPPTVPVTRTLTQRSRSRSRDSRQSAVSHIPSGGRARSSSASSRSRRPRSLSSSESSIASSVDSTPSCTPAATPTHNTQQSTTTTNAAPRRPCDRNRQNDMPESDSPLGQWPNSLSSMMACLGCTLGLFNISRFAIATVHFGANFIFQFIVLSLIFGLPLFTLQLCLGQQLGAGVIDMWRISPLFQGVGVSLLISQALMGLYSIVGISWMFVFFRDSFITKLDKYRWAEPFVYYRNDIQPPVNGTYKLSETIPDYFNGIVLQRHHLPSGTSYGTIKFQLAFNLAVVWMIVFVSLSKGLRSYGKVIYGFILLPVFGTFILCAKILGLMPPEYINIFPETSWGEFFLNPKCWLAAAQETFLTWGLLGAAVMQIASHNKHKHLLQRDSSLVAVITISILLLVAFLANTCVQILSSYGYSYQPDSFERMSSYTFLRFNKDPLPPNLANTPVRYMAHNSFIVGERIIRPGIDHTSESGYQVLRLATELIPATFAVMGPEQLSPFWAVLFYFILIMFGIAQQLAIWHCLITGIMAIKAKVLKSWETTITFFSCACGFVLGLPMATELGIYVVYFFDYTIGGIWWLILIILLQIIAVFMVRGRPYSGDTVVTALFNPSTHPCLLSWAPPLLSFTWNVILPVALMVLCISTFKNGGFREIFIWHHAPVAEYWPLWARQIGSMLQLLPVLCVPIVAVIQSYRYLNNGPNDILDRIQLLYRPPIGEHMDDLAVQEAAAATSINNHNNNAVQNIQTEDPPPKYTPPPSYTTATGARIAKFLRQSIRRSVRRLANVLGESSSTRQRAAIANANLQQPPPPDYNAVLVEMNNTTTTDVSIDLTDSSRNPRISTLERLRNLGPSSSALTAAEVASILRSSFRRSTLRPTNNIRNANFNEHVHFNDTNGSLSAENLVESAAPIGETSLVVNNLPIESKSESDNLSTVI